MSSGGAGSFARGSYPALALNNPTPASRAAFSSLSSRVASGAVRLVPRPRSRWFRRGNTTPVLSKHLPRHGSKPPAFLNQFLETRLSALDAFAQRSHSRIDVAVSQLRFTLRHWHEHRSRHPTSGDRNLLAFGHPVQKRRQMSFRLECPDAFHKTNLNQLDCRSRACQLYFNPPNP